MPFNRKVKSLFCRLGFDSFWVGRQHNRGLWLAYLPYRHRFPARPYCNASDSPYKLINSIASLRSSPLFSQFSLGTCSPQSATSPDALLFLLVIGDRLKDGATTPARGCILVSRLNLRHNSSIRIGRFVIDLEWVLMSSANLRGMTRGSR